MVGKRRTNAIFSTVVAVVFLVVGGHSTWAVERTGQVVESILDDIDGKMNALDQNQATIEREKKEIIKERDRLFAEFESEKDEIRKHELAALLQEELEKESRSEMREIQLYLDTLGTLIPRFKELHSALSTANVSAGEAVSSLNRVRSNVARLLQNGSRIAHALHEIDPDDPAVNETMDKLLLIQDVYNRELNVGSAERSLAQIKDYVTHLNTLYAKMALAATVIEQERKKLAVINTISLSNIALLRVNNSVSIAEINKRPEDIIKNSRERNYIMARTVDFSPSQRPVVSQTGEQYRQLRQQRIMQMAQGKVFHK